MTDMPDAPRPNLSAMQRHALYLVCEMPGSCVADLTMIANIEEAQVRRALQQLRRMGLAYFTGRVRHQLWSPTEAGRAWTPPDPNPLQTNRGLVGIFYRMVDRAGIPARRISEQATGASNPNLVHYWFNRGVEPRLFSFEAALNVLGYKLQIVPIEEEERT